MKLLVTKHTVVQKKPRPRTFYVDFDHDARTIVVRDPATGDGLEWDWKKGVGTGATNALKYIHIFKRQFPD